MESGFQIVWCDLVWRKIDWGVGEKKERRDAQFFLNVFYDPNLRIIFKHILWSTNNLFDN
jgi:hypothetical protein